MYTFQMFGGVRLADESGPLNGAATQRRRLAVLALLACAPAGSVSRDKLIGYLWPDLDTDSGRSRLADALHGLRKAMGRSTVISSGEDVCLNPARISTDVAAFAAARAAGNHARAAALYRGPFLDGFYVTGAPEFERWIEVERQSLAGDYARVLQSLALESEAAGDPRAAAEWLQRLAAHDPYSSRVSLHLMRTLAAGGDAGAALLHARSHADRLRQDLGVDTSPEITQYVRELQRADIAPSDAAEVLMAGVGSTGTAAALPGGRGRAAVAGSPETSAVVPSHVERLAAPAVAPPTAPAGTGASRRRIPRAVGAVAALGAVLIAAVTLPPVFARQSAVTVDRQRVVVVPLVNRTGDTRFDPLGSMAADWITEGLARTRIASVVPFSTALAASRTLESAGNLDAGLARAMAREAGAGIVVTGSFYLQGDTIILSTQVSDGLTGTVLEGVEPVHASSDDPSGAFDELQDRVLAALGPHVNPRLQQHARTTGRTPSFGAYREYAAGLERIGNHADADWRAALAHFARAAELDPSYMLPLVRAAELYTRVNNFAAADSLARLVEPHMGDLAEYDRLVITIAAARARGERHRSYHAALRGAEIAPNTILHFDLARELLAQHRPAEALRVFLDMDPTRGELRGYAVYWVKRTEAHHLVGDYRGELDAARTARALMPDYANALRLEIRALTALGRTTEAMRLLDGYMSGPGGGHPQAGPIMGAISLELRAHGHAALSATVDRRAIEWLEWYRARTGNTLHLADTYYQAGMWQEAAELIHARASSRPGDIGLHGRMGLLAARTGDLVEAARIDRRLAEVDAPYLLGMNSLWRARIAAVRGERELAVELIRNAFAEGHSWWLDLHYDIDFESLRDYPPFQELIRPRG
jgi:DNA-binding SARP family transcriptional activator/TolB-like protein